MKLKPNALSRVALLALAAGALSTTSLMAGTPDKTPAPVTPAPEEPFVTGNLTVLYETHFISYGQDVWGIGNSWKDALIHPSLELDFNMGGGLQAYVNTWWDVNSLGVTTIGSQIQEVDINAGFYYTMDKWKLQLGYGAWNYASQTESVIDFKLSHTDVLNPFVAVHARIADRFAEVGIPLERGVVGQVGIAPALTLGPVSLSFPVTVSVDSHDFHGGDGGFAYVSAGISGSIPLTKHISMILGATYYHTNHNVIPNPEDDFVVGSGGFSISF